MIVASRDPRRFARGLEARPVQNRGFTLIEIVVVIGIIILAAGFMVPSLAKFFSNRALNTAGTLVTQLMNSARSEAVTTKKSVWVVFLKRGLRIYKEADGSWEGGLHEYDSSDQNENIQYRLEFSGFSYAEYRQTVVDQDEGVTLVKGNEGDFSAGDIALEFKPDGTISFGQFTDILTSEYDQEHPSKADIIIDQKNEPYVKGFIDIRPTGRVVFKIAELEE